MSFNEWHFNEFCKDNYDLESDQQKAIYDRIHSHAFEKSKKDAQEEVWGFQQAKIDELQARIDEASNKIDFWVGGKNGDAIHVAKSIGNILKGNKDEN